MLLNNEDLRLLDFILKQMKDPESSIYEEIKKIKMMMKISGENPLPGDHQYGLPGPLEDYILSLEMNIDWLNRAIMAILGDKFEYENSDELRDFKFDYEQEKITHRNTSRRLNIY